MEAPEFVDSIDHGAGTELLLVEGNSAVGALERGRADRWQAILSMQGKIPNALRASEAKVHAHLTCAMLFDRLGSGSGEGCDLSKARYERVVICTDPDADGTHLRVLLTVLFLRWLTPWLAAGRVFTAHAPLYRLTIDYEHHYAFTEAHYARLVAELKAGGGGAATTTRFKGLGQMETSELRRTLLDPATRRLGAIDLAAAERTQASFASFLAP